MDILDIPPEDWNDTGIVNLSIAIIQQACEDYKRAYMGEIVDHRDSEWMMRDIEKWVKSPDYEYLTKVNGSALLKKVRITALEEMIEVYEEVLNSGRDAKIRLFVQKPKGMKNVNFQIPWEYSIDIFNLMREQLKTLKYAKEREEVSNERQKIGA